MQGGRGVYQCPEERPVWSRRQIRLQQQLCHADHACNRDTRKGAGGGGRSEER